jgi:hypothetical protein
LRIPASIASQWTQGSFFFEVSTKTGNEITSDMSYLVAFDCKKVEPNLKNEIVCKTKTAAQSS